MTTYQSSLLYSLFFYRSLDLHDGLITHALLRLCRHYQLDSIEALAARNSDYLMDAVLIQLRVATTLRSNAVEDQLSFLAAVWRDQNRGGSARPVPLPVRTGFRTDLHGFVGVQARCT